MMLEELSADSSGDSYVSKAIQNSLLICRGSFNRQCNFISADLKELIHPDFASEIFCPTSEFIGQRTQIANTRCCFPFFDVTRSLRWKSRQPSSRSRAPMRDWGDERIKAGKLQQLERKNNQYHRSLFINFWSTSRHLCSDSSTAELKAVISFDVKAIWTDFVQFSYELRFDSIILLILRETKS